MTAKLGQPVVIGPKAGLLKLSILQPEEDKADGGIQYCGLNPV